MSEYLEERGVCFFAYNNDQIDYAELAVLAAGFVKKYLNLPVCLITDEGTSHWLAQSQNKKETKFVFDYMVITDDEMKQNHRRHFDSPWTEFSAQFNNSNKHKIWEYSPFEKTLLLDIDYIVRSDFLLKVFETNSSVSMFDHAINLRNELPAGPERFLYDAGVKMWWSTVVYFDRSDFSKLFFDTWAHVAENYSFYQYLYNFPGKLFRTDYCVSIAAHILSGMQDNDIVDNFNGVSMVNMSQKDDIVSVVDTATWNFLAVDAREQWKNILVQHTGIDVHVMNKRALKRVMMQLKDKLYVN